MVRKAESENESHIALKIMDIPIVRTACVSRKDDSDNELFQSTIAVGLIVFSMNSKGTSSLTVNMD